MLLCLMHAMKLLRFMHYLINKGVSNDEYYEFYLTARRKVVKTSPDWPEQVLQPCHYRQCEYDIRARKARFNGECIIIYLKNHEMTNNMAKYTSNFVGVSFV